MILDALRFIGMLAILGVVGLCIYSQVTWDGSDNGVPDDWPCDWDPGWRDHWPFNKYEEEEDE